MTSIISSIYDELVLDAELLTYLTGGLYNGEEILDITRQVTPDAYDEFLELKPSALLKAETSTPWGPHHDSGRTYITFWMYAQTNFGQLEQARDRLYQLLHRSDVMLGQGVYDIRHANDIQGAEVASLNIPTIVSRYVVTLQRAR